MKASELIERFSLMSDPWSRDAAIMLERFISLPDELERICVKPSNEYTQGKRNGLDIAATQIREIAGENGD